MKGLGIWAFVILHSSFVIAAAPGFESLFPAGGQVGARVETTVAGKGLEKGTFLGWSSDPHVVLLAGDKPKKFFLSIAKDAVPGPCLVRIYSETDASPPRIIEVGKFEELIEKEPNDTFSDARKTDPRMNVTINGVLEKAGDVDTHVLRVQKGRRISLILHGYSLGSPMDPAMRLLNDRGVEVAAAHDSTNLDPRLEYTPLADGTLYAQLFAFVHPPAADVSFKGSVNHVYRLTVSDEPKPPVTLSEPPVLTPPLTTTGCLGRHGEEDAYTFPLKKSQSLQINVRAQAIHSPVDAILRIEDAKGKVIQQADDADKDSLDPSLRFKAAEDGDYKLIIADRFHHGGADHLYELTVKPFVPTLTATLDTHAYHLDAGKTAEVKLTVKPSGTFTGKIKAQAANLPPGVTAESVEVPAKGGEIKLTLKAAADAAASQAPFAVQLITTAPDPVETLTATYPIPFTEPRGDLLIPSDTHPWLTVVAKKP